MKNYKTPPLLFLLIFGVIFLIFLIINISLSKNDYATLTIEGDNNSYILVNDSEKYCYMPYYSYKSTPDLKIRNGKQPIFNIFKQDFGAYSKDSQRDFLYCWQSGFGVQIVGLYIKERSMDYLLMPTSSNIYRICILNDNNDEILHFNSKDEDVFDFFVEKYSKDLNDYFFPLNSRDKTVFNEKYNVYVEYQNGDISRFLRCINETEFETLRSLKK